MGQRGVSLLEFDVTKVYKIKLRRFTNMTKVEREMWQVVFISPVVNSIVNGINEGRTQGTCWVRILPDAIYPYLKMIDDIKKALTNNSVIMEDVLIVTRGNIRKVRGIRFSYRVDNNKEEKQNED